MSTPFEFFRRHQKVALAAITGTAVLSFVVFDASNSNHLSPTGLAILVTGCLAIVGWIWGAGEGKSGENAIFGGVLGIALSLAFMFVGRPQPAVSAITGNLSRADLQNLGRDRGMANRMVNLVFYEGNPLAKALAGQSAPWAQQYIQGSLSQYLFGFGVQDQSEDVLLTELFNREADELGIQITDDAVMTYLKEVVGKDKKGEEGLTQEVYRDALKNTIAGFPGSSEPTIFEAIRHEMRARQAANILLGGERLTPSDVWDIHRKLNTRESAEFVALPVEEFVDPKAQPTDAELKEFFDTYKGNYPNFAENGLFAEGRPGLYKSRQVRVAYLTPNYEELQKQAGEVTEEEIQQRYELQYQRSMPADLDANGELIPSGVPQPPATPAGTPVPAATAPATEKPAETPPAEPAAPATREKPAEPPAPVTPPAPETSATPEVKPAEPAVPPAETQPAAPPAKPEGTSLRERRSALQPVVLIQETPAAATEKPAEAAPAATPEVPATPAATPEVPAAPAATPEPAAAAPAAPAPEASQPAAPAAESKPAEVKPAGEAPAAAPLTVPPAAGGGADNDPAPPVSLVRPLDDVLRQQIRDDLLAEKAQPLAKDQVGAARDFMSDLHLGVSEYLSDRNSKAKSKPALSKDAMSPEEATKRLKEYAQKNGLVYAETPLLTPGDLERSTEYPVGAAQVPGRDASVARTLEQSKGDDLCLALTASSFDRKEAFAFWKIEDVAAHVPASLDEAGVKQNAIKSWRTFKAREVAEKRAKALTELIAKSDKPMAETLGEQTITGEAKEKSLFLTVQATGDFSWLVSSSSVPGQLREEGAPRFGTISGIQGAGDSFMSKIFNEMQPGQTEVVPNLDRSVFYVMRIEKRSPGTESEVAVMRRQFLESQGMLSRYANQQVHSRNPNIASRLFLKHGVIFPRSKEEDDR